MYESELCNRVLWSSENCFSHGEKAYEFQSNVISRHAALNNRLIANNFNRLISAFSVNFLSYFMMSVGPFPEKTIWQTMKIRNDSLEN